MSRPTYGKCGYQAMFTYLLRAVIRYIYSKYAKQNCLES